MVPLACRTTAPTASRLRNCLKEQHRPALCCVAPNETGNAPAALTTTPQNPPRLRNGSMIRSLAAAVELNGQVQRYETFAGRSAMVGVAAAACIEVITDHSVFFPVTNDTAVVYACVALTTLSAAVGIAFARGRSDAPSTDTNVDILEAVYASLTAARRSAASVTQAQVDKAVDYVWETVLDGRFDCFSIDGVVTHSDGVNEDEQL